MNGAKNSTRSRVAMGAVSSIVGVPMLPRIANTEAFPRTSGVSASGDSCWMSSSTFMFSFASAGS